MPPQDDTASTVLVVEDESATARMYESVLEDDYDVLTASDGERGLEIVEAEPVDVVLLDRRMPEMSGDEVLGELERRDVDCRVAMVTAVAPDFDIVEMGLDDYLVKPVGVDELRETVERLLALATYDEKYRELSAKRVKRNVLEVEKPDAELRSSDEFEELTARIDALEAELEDIEDEYDVLPRR